jgi:hypothetical protein
MQSLSKQDRDKALRATMFMCMRQLQGIEPEEQGAQKLGFGSVEAMRIQLTNWGLPELITQSEPIGEKPKVPKSPPPERKKRGPRPQELGPAKELPPADNATPLFKERLEALLKSVELLRHMDESLHGEYFVRQDVEIAGALLPRELLSEEHLQLLSEQHNLDLDDESVFVPDAPVKLPGGVALSPTETEAILIGVYALADGDTDRLLDALHLDPASVGTETREEIEDKRDELKVLARHLATWVRGSEVRRGRPPRLSKADHAFACAITHYRRQGHTDEEIALKESDRKKEDGTSYTVKDVTQLGNLGLSWP